MKSLNSLFASLFSNKRAALVALSALLYAFNWSVWDQGLRQVSVWGTGWLLGIFYRVHVSGDRLFLCGQDILLETPGSGAMYGFCLLALYIAVVMFKRPTSAKCMEGLVKTLLWIVVANTVRTFILSTGVAFPNLVGHVSIMAQPWQAFTGVTILLLLGFLPVCWWAMTTPAAQNGEKRKTESMDTQLTWKVGRSSVNPATSSTLVGRIKLWLACTLVACVMSIIVNPAKPMARSGELSNSLNYQEKQPGYLALLLNHIPKRALEIVYLSRFGPKSIRLRYGQSRTGLVRKGRQILDNRCPIGAVVSRIVGRQWIGLGVSQRARKKFLRQKTRKCYC